MSTNNSNKNSYYRFKITNISDISESTYLRRLAKSQQNNKKSFFFEIEADSKHLDLIVDFLTEKIRTADSVLCSFKCYTLLTKNISPEQVVLKISTADELQSLIKSDLQPQITKILFAPKIYKDLKVLAQHYQATHMKFSYFWMFSPYDPSLIDSITAKQITQFNIDYKTISGLEIFNTKVPVHYELEPITNTSYRLDWEFSLAESQPLISVIIPSYNNAGFLSNVVWHLINQNVDKRLYEIVICDDGSTDQSSQILSQVFKTYEKSVNIKYIYWSKKHPVKGEQQFFRPGLARNLASRYSRGEYLQFLDSDILVPENFIATCLNEMKSNDIIQFQRFHIHQELSKTSPNYTKINLKTDTYIEEKEYWSELFFCDRWSDLPNYWKYTCTYALGIHKSKFYEMGLFKKYYISYGFEDTDLGYESHKLNLKFNLIKLPLLHLTAYDQMQYKNSFSKRFELLRTTAELFFLQNLDKNVFHLFGNYYRAQKPIKSFVRDLFS